MLVARKLFVKVCLTRAVVRVKRTKNILRLGETFWIKLKVVDYAKFHTWKNNSFVWWAKTSGVGD